MAAWWSSHFRRFRRSITPRSMIRFRPSEDTDEPHQQEIVKQLLYREEPKSARASRFRRIERFSWGREAALALMGGAVVSLAFMILGWAGTIERTLRPLLELGLWVYRSSRFSQQARLLPLAPFSRPGPHPPVLGMALPP